MVTDDELRQIMPNLPAVKRALYLPHLQAAMAEFGITTMLREAAFLGQVAHESAEFRFMEEIWGPTSAQRRYEPPSSLARTLGNTEPGDGKRFKGRGPIQLTGRANYQRFGSLLGIDLVGNPPLAAEPSVAFRTAGLYWKSRGLNELADVQNYREITRRINGGFNGFEDRLKFYNRAKSVLSQDAPVGAGETRGISSDDGAAANLPPERDVPPNLSRGILPGELEKESAASARGGGGAAKKGGAKKGAAKKSAKKAAAKKSAAKKGAAKKGGAAKKSTSKKGAAKKSGAKRGAAKKGSAKKGAAKKGAAKRGGRGR